MLREDRIRELRPQERLAPAAAQRHEPPKIGDANLRALRKPPPVAKADPKHQARINAGTLHDKFLPHQKPLITF